jgi:hypothetical protein
MTTYNFGNSNNINLITDSSSCNINLVGTNDISLNLAQLTLNQENIGNIKTNYNTLLLDLSAAQGGEDISFNDLSLNFDISVN